jgi:hypothetical protein
MLTSILYCVIHIASEREGWICLEMSSCELSWVCVKRHRCYESEAVLIRAHVTMLGMVKTADVR